MNNLLLNLYVKIQNLMSSDEGQDMVEYALVLALVALGATATLKALATEITTVYTTITTDLTNAV
ncbi:MAG TPA: hypothetical protein VMA34_21435 [Terracidiphilus sp.]|nr:hypothetical protein [Terracidiphilus sp.]